MNDDPTQIHFINVKKGATAAMNGSWVGNLEKIGRRRCFQAHQKVRHKREECCLTQKMSVTEKLAGMSNYAGNRKKV
jgi:hypothetical protein